MAQRERRIVVELSYTFDDGADPASEFVPVGDLPLDRKSLREYVVQSVGEENFVVINSFVTDYKMSDTPRCPECMMNGDIDGLFHEFGCPHINVRFK